MKNIFMMLLLVCLNVYAKAQTIVQLEYFIDNDAGFGKNILVTVTPGSDDNFAFTANLTGVPAGYHNLYIRTKDTNGQWSQTTRKTIEVIRPVVTNNIIAGEYFFNNDPGFGNANPVTVSPQGIDITQSFVSSTASLAPGFHNLYIRTKDSYGAWSMTTRKKIEVIRENGTAQIIGVEYFFAADAGVGKAPYISFANFLPDGTFDFQIPQNLVNNRKDTLFLRVKDSTNKNWSLTQWVIADFSTVSCTVPDQPAAMTNDSKCSGSTATYTVGSVAGATGYNWEVPAGWTITAGQGTATVSLLSPSVSSATDYILSVTATNTCGAGLPATFTVTINPLPPVPILTADPGTTICSGNSVVLTSSATSGNQWFKDADAIAGAGTASYTAAIAGNYTVIVTDSKGCSAISAETIVTVNTSPSIPVITANGATTFCTGSNVVLTSSAASGNQWLKDGLEITGETEVTFTATTTGNYTVRTTNSGGCSSLSVAKVVIVNAVPAKPVITQNGNILSSSASAGNQWFLNNAIITGATGQTYTPAVSGIYTVQTTANSCISEISDAINFQVTAITDPTALDDVIKIFPNPVPDKLIITSRNNNPVRVLLYDMSGRRITSVRKITGTYQLEARGWKSGCYYIVVTDERSNKSSVKLLFKK